MSINIVDKLFKDNDISVISEMEPELRHFIFEYCKYMVSNDNSNSQRYKDILIHGNCVTRSKMPLKNYQTQAVEEFSKRDSLLLLFDTGTGKTLTAYTIAQCFLDSNPHSNIFIVSPPKLKNNFSKEALNYGGTLSNMSTYSFNNILNMADKGTPLDCTDALLIIDEAHKLMNYKGLMFEAVMQCAIKAKKILLLTATPVINHISDLISIINLLHKKYIISPLVNSDKSINQNNRGKKPDIFTVESTEYKFKISQSRNREKRDDIMFNEMYKLGPLLRDKVLVVKKSVDDADYPSVEITDILVKMTKDFETKYKALIPSKSYRDVFVNVKFPSAFFNVWRRAVNKTEKEYYSMKIDNILPKLGAQQTVIFTNWIEFGVNILSEIMNKYDISYAIINGETQNTRDIINNYNKGKIKVLVLTSSSAEGLNLLKTRNLIITDPVWNPSKLEQIIGRAVRYKSHSDLPPEERHVNVFRMILIEESIEDSMETSISGDVILYNIIKHKEKMLKEFNEFIKKNSIAYIKSNQ